MPKLDLTKATRIKVAGGEISRLKVGPAIWIRPIISITSGTGYAGSVYTSTVAGQWYANGVAISGYENTTTYVQTIANESAVIRCCASNTIQMWTPEALVSAVEYLDLRRSDALTLAAGRVASIVNLIGGQARSQNTASAQPVYNSTGLNGLPMMTGSNSLLSGNLDTGNQSVWRVSLALMSGVTAGRPVIELNRATPDSTTPSTFRPMHVFSSTATGAYVAGTTVQTVVTDGTPVIGHSRIVIGGSISVGSASVADSSIATPAATLTNRSTVTYFNRASGGILSVGVSMAQVVIGTGELSVADQQRIEGFMAHSYGLSALLPTAHPYKTNAPRIL